MLDFIKHALKSNRFTHPCYQTLYNLYYQYLNFSWKFFFRRFRITAIKKHLLERKRSIDYLYGVDTAGRIEVFNLKIDSPNKFKSLQYQPSHEALFKTLLTMEKIPKQGFVFIDFGAGKGLPLLLASFHPFKKIIGVEFSEELCAIARKNILKIRNNAQRCQDITILFMDVTRYVIPDDPVILYMCNPFNDEIMIKVVELIEQRIIRSPEPLLVIYLNPRHVEVLNASVLLQNVTEHHLADCADPRFAKLFSFHAARVDQVTGPR
ncbi:MAG: hypothetical protein HQM02_04670 [Magnetococcales bacterium]|nr:hypothetical protein [Magnetococcales bacterium]